MTTNNRVRAYAKTLTKPSTPAKWQIPMRKTPAGRMEFYLEGELKDKFCELYPKTSNRRMMFLFGIKLFTLQRFKRKLGLKRDAQDISELRKEMWHKERLRIKYDLERQTTYRIPVKNLTHVAHNHKSMMIRQCNYFADPLGDPYIVCYDSQTRRSAKREATAVRHGLKVVEAEE